MGANNEKFTFQYVKSFFENKGCVLLEVEYINSAAPMRYICACGNERTISFGKFKNRKNGCRICNGLEKYTQEYVSQYLENEGCKLLSEYTGSNDELIYQCSCGNISTSTFSNFLRGKRCIQCGSNKLADQFKHDIDYVRKYFIEQNCEPLFDEYINTHASLKYKCVCGEIGYTAFADFQSGKRCGNCRLDRIRKSMYENGTGTISIQQKYIHSIIGGEINYPINSLSLDIAFPNIFVYVEYDGGGHDLGIKLGSKTPEEFEEYERKRRYALYRRNWKEIRIVSVRDRLPNKDKIQEMFDFASKHFEESSSSWIKFDIDKSTVESKMFNEYFNYGEIKRIR